MIPFNLKECLESGIAVTGCPGSGKTTLLKQLAEHLMNNGVTVYVVDVSKAWNTNTPFHNFIEITKMEDIQFEAKSTVFDISKLSFRQKQRWVNNFVGTLYNGHMNGYTAKEFIIFEECHVCIPSGAMRSPQKYENVINLVTVGRNFSLRFALATQFPAMCDANLFKSPQQRYFGWTTEFNDVSRIRSYFPRKRKNELEEVLRSLGKLCFMYQYGNTIDKFKIDYYQAEEPICPDTTQPYFTFTFNYST
jgi:hypothetical protein